MDSLNVGESALVPASSTALTTESVIDFEKPSPWQSICVGGQGKEPCYIGDEKVPDEIDWSHLFLGPGGGYTDIIVGHRNIKKVYIHGELVNETVQKLQNDIQTLKSEIEELKFQLWNELRD